MTARAGTGHPRRRRPGLPTPPWPWRCATRCPGAELVVLEQTGHELPAERWGRVRRRRWSRTRLGCRDEVRQSGCRSSTSSPTRGPSPTWPSRQRTPGGTASSSGTRSPGVHRCSLWRTRGSCLAAAATVTCSHRPRADGQPTGAAPPGQGRARDRVARPAQQRTPHRRRRVGQRPVRAGVLAHRRARGGPDRERRCSTRASRSCVVRGPGSPSTTTARHHLVDDLTFCRRGRCAAGSRSGWRASRGTCVRCAARRGTTASSRSTSPPPTSWPRPWTRVPDPARGTVAPLRRRRRPPAPGTDPDAVAGGRRDLGPHRSGSGDPATGRGARPRARRPTAPRLG